VSKHLRVLEDAGLVRRTIAGRDHWIELAPQPLREAADWIGTYRDFWEGRLDALESMLGSKVPR
jgi:DNA-binding transcriptional ArsR family regulator